MRLDRQLMAELSEYLRLNYSGDMPPVGFRPVKAALKAKQATEPEDSTALSKEDTALGSFAAAPLYRAAAPYGDLNDRLNTLDESFQQALLRLIDERGMKDSRCYHRAGVDRKLFSKIRSNPSYRPSKPTAVAFAIALELDLDETADLLRKAGYALSHSSKFDVIVEYFIVNKRYDLRELNTALYEFDQPLING